MAEHGSLANSFAFRKQQTGILLKWRLFADRFCLSRLLVVSMGLDIQRAASEVEKIVGHEVGSTTDKYENTVRDYHASACVPSRNRSWGPS